MKNREDIIQYLQRFDLGKENAIEFDEDAILADYQKDDGNQSLAIKILSVIGGILASLAFLGFLFITGIYNSEISLIVTGLIFIYGAVFLIKFYDKILVDTISISIYIIGLILVGMACGNLFSSENIICYICIITAVISLVLVQSFILSFINIVIINGSLISLMLLNNLPNLIHFYISILAILLSFILLKEAKFLTHSRAISKLYNPMRTALTFTFIFLIILLKNDSMTIPNKLIWTSSVIHIGLILFLISSLVKRLNVNNKKYELGIYIICFLTLAPTAISPGISGSLLLLLLSFLVNYRTGFVLAALSFIYFISEFYYDLNFTLLTKSILLFVTGILFIGLYWLISKKSTHEKI